MDCNLGTDCSVVIFELEGVRDPLRDEQLLRPNHGLIVVFELNGLLTPHRMG